MKEARIARFGSPGPGSGTSYRASGPSSSWAITPSSPSQIGAGLVCPRIARSTASIAAFPAKAGADAFHVEISPLRDCRVAVVVWSAWPIAW